MTLHDNGGTLNGGVDTSSSKSMTITITGAASNPKTPTDVPGKNYADLTVADITPIVDKSGKQVLSGNSDGSGEMKSGSVILFKTRSGLYGKLSVDKVDYNLNIRYVVYDAAGKPARTFEGSLRGTYTLHLESGQSTDLDRADIWWNMQTMSTGLLQALGTARLALYIAP